MNGCDLSSQNYPERKMKTKLIVLAIALSVASAQAADRIA
ncbi:autoinducer 2 ABC transporter substrate-binding protein, partial [Enterobacter sp. 63]